MVVRVAERARASGAERVVIATDDERIRAAAVAHGIEAVLTRADHATGTDRLAEAALLLGLDDAAIVVNVQGDEPLLEPALIRAVAERVACRADAAIATACHPIEDPEEGFNPNVVKVVLDHAGYALYFSRATIPWARDAFAVARNRLPAGLPLYRHYGLYAYRVGFLRHFPRWRRPRSSASRRSSSCGRCGTATASPCASPRAPPRPASTRRRISTGCARFMPRARFDRALQ